MSPATVPFRDALVEVLSGILPEEITKCTSCHKIQEDDERWLAIPGYMSAHGQHEVTHSICNHLCESEMWR